MYSKMKLCVKSTYINNISNHPCYCNNLLQSTFTTQSSCNRCASCNNEQNDICYFSPLAGVFQGESLSPVLFSFFVNDINEFMKDGHNIGISIYHLYMVLILFADDMVLFSDNRFGLQQGLDRLHDYCNTWGLTVNVEKTKCMVFKNGGRVSAFDKWTYNGHALETVKSFRYLGFVFSSSGKFKLAFNSIVLQGERAIFKMYSSIENFETMYIDMQLSLFNSLVTSILCYACEIWGFAQAKAIETLHLKFLKKILKVKKTTPNCMIYKECNVYPLYYNRVYRIIGYWLKIIKLDDDNPLKIIYTASITEDVYNVNSSPLSWSHNVKSILYTNGFGYIWDSQNVGISKHFIHTFNERLID